MSETQKKQDQAIGLRQQMKQHQSEGSTKKEGVPSLPPRAEFHNRKRKKTKIKLSFPLIRLLVLLFFILIIVFLASPYWLR